MEKSTKFAILGFICDAILGGLILIETLFLQHYALGILIVIVGLTALLMFAIAAIFYKIEDNKKKEGDNE